MNRSQAYLKTIECTFGPIIVREFRLYPGRWICTRCSGEGYIDADKNYTGGKCPVCHGWGYIYDTDRVQDKLLTLTPEEAHSCPDCGRPNDGTIVIRRASTAYVNDVCNWDICCLDCYLEHEDYWKERWDEYNAGRL